MLSFFLHFSRFLCQIHSFFSFSMSNHCNFASLSLSLSITCIFKCSLQISIFPLICKICIVLRMWYKSHFCYYFLVFLFSFVFESFDHMRLDVLCLCACDKSNFNNALRICHLLDFFLLYSHLDFAQLFTSKNIAWNVTFNVKLNISYHFPNYKSIKCPTITRFRSIYPTFQYHPPPPNPFLLTLCVQSPPLA